MKILYVEDDPFDADLTQRELRKTSPESKLDIVRTRREAMQLLEGAPDYDMLLTDLRLPDGGGFDLLSFVRTRGLAMAVVVITGQGDEDTAVSVLKAGADDYVVKRQNYLSSLSLTLERVLRRYRAEAARQVRPLQVLYADQNLNDIDAVSNHFSIRAPHIHLEIAYSVAEIYERLSGEPAAQKYDALLMDYRLDGLNALEVLKELRQERELDLPIVMVTAFGDQEIAAQALRLGASDYVVKGPGYLYQLPGLLENAYHHVQLQREQQALRASETRFRSLIENSADGMLLVNAEGEIIYASPSMVRYLGMLPEQVLHTHLLDYIHPDDVEHLEATWREMLTRPASVVPLEGRARRGDSWRWFGATLSNSLEEPAVQGIVINLRDITERKHAEERIQRQLHRLNTLRTMDMAIATGLDLRVTLAVLLDHVLVQLGVHAAAVLLYNQQTQLLEHSAGRGFRSRAFEGLRFRLGQGYAGRVAVERRTVHASNLASNEAPSQIARLYAEEGFVEYYAAPLIAKGQVKGVLEVFHREPLNPDPEWISFLETLAGQATLAVDNAELFEHLQRANLDLTLSYDTTIEGIVRSLDLRNLETEGHAQRVVDMSVRLAMELGINEENTVFIRRGAWLHDIGKISIPDSILHKPGPLTDDERECIRRHPLFAFELLSPIPYLRPSLDIPYCHHEKWDGTGYPRQIKGEQIPLAARLFSVVDVWDALSYDRPYRQRWDRAHVVEHIQFLSGLHFDPQMVEVFLRLAESENW